MNRPFSYIFFINIYSILTFEFWQIFEWVSSSKVNIDLEKIEKCYHKNEISIIFISSFFNQNLYIMDEYGYGQCFSG